MSRLNLFELTYQIQSIADRMLDAIELDDTEYFEELESQLAQFHHAREDKLESYVHVIKNATAAAEAVKAEANAFYARAKALENLSSRLKKTLMEDLIKHDQKAAEAGNFRIRRQASPASVSVNVKPSDLPEEYQRITVDADKGALKSALQSGEEIEGVELTEGEHLRIRVK